MTRRPGIRACVALRLARHAMAGCLALSLITACGGGAGEGESRRAARTARNGGTLRIPLINDPILDPVIAPDIGSVMVNKVLFPGLVRPDETLRPTPDLAESWTTSDDGLRITFKLRPGVTWHDGAPFSAHDVKFTFDQIVDLSSGSRLRSDFAALAGVDVEDSLTVAFRLRTPFAPFLTLLGYNAGILPKHLLQGKPLSAATDFNRRHPVGTGPFMVQEVVPGASITLVRNPRYVGSAPHLDRIVFKVVPDLNAQVAQLRAGELDLITIEPANLASVQGAPGIEVLQVPVVQHYYVAFNTARPRFRSAEVRRALGMAVNREAIIRGVLRDYADLPRGTIPVALKDYFAD
ncbi:MAG: ABC transporter substrate-binding protein, partial [Gemmatimonadota bacterium]